VRVVVESPLGADTPTLRRDNLCFALWCCRAMELQGNDPIASHVIKPWWLDDTDPRERALGMASEWAWLPEVPHVFFTDLGMSIGMRAAWDRCGELGIVATRHRLCDFDPHCRREWAQGHWPPHTAGFEVRGALVRVQSDDIGGDRG